MPHHPFNPSRDPLPHELATDQLEAFESWCKQCGLDTYKRLDGTGYDDSKTALVWSAWSSGMAFASQHTPTQSDTERDAARCGWKEAVIAWEVCASIHREWAKGKDGVFKTRQADFIRHAENARKQYARIDAAMGAQTAGEKS